MKSVKVVVISCMCLVIGAAVPALTEGSTRSGKRREVADPFRTLRTPSAQPLPAEDRAPLPGASDLRAGPVGDALVWLRADQNASGSWGTTLPLTVTSTVIETLVAIEQPTELDPGSTELADGAAWLTGQTASNHDFLARQIAALAGVPGSEVEVSPLVTQLLAARNAAEWDTGLPNWPEGGWGLAVGFETDCLTTALAMKALDSVGLNGGFVVNNEPLAAGATNTHEWDIPTDATKARLLVTVAGSTVRVRMKQGSPPGPGDPWFELPPGTWLIVFPDSGLPFTPGRNYVTVQSTGPAATYSMTASYETPSFNTLTLAEPLAYLREAQNVDGGWGLQRGQATEFYTTLHTILTLLLYQNYDFDTELTSAIAYLKSQQLGDGSFGYDLTPIAYVTALASLNLVRAEAYPFTAETLNAISALLAMQALDGSWDQQAYDTALAILALWDRNQDPVADAGADQLPADTNADCLEIVTLDATASTDVDGTIDSYVWTEDDVEIATGAAPMVTLVVGTHNLVLTVTDNGGKSASDTVTIDVIGTGAPSDTCHCCFSGGACQDIDALACAASGGTPVPGACAIEACCLPDDTCRMLDMDCCVQQGGTPLPGEICTDPTNINSGCCLPGGGCEMLDPLCCALQGGVSQPISDVCTTPEACCLPDGSCDLFDPVCCDDLGGVPQGSGSACTDVEACCMPDGTCTLADTLCCVNELGGTPQGIGSTCGGVEACCLPDDTCVEVDALCCTNELGGTPEGPGSTCGGVEACCLPDDTCFEVDALCCVNELGGTPQGPASTCGGVEACCLPDDTCVEVDARCCTNELGGTPQGPGSTCGGVEACCLPDGTCTLADALCCVNDLSGTPQGPGSTCGGVEACCLPDGTCTLADALCCVNDLGGTPQGPGSTCGGEEACCLPDDACVMADALCCVNVLGGTPQGAGSTCTAVESCCLPSGECRMLDPECCDDLGGVPGFQSTCQGDLNGNGINDACEQLTKRPMPQDELGVSCASDGECINDAVCIPDDEGAFPGTCYVPKNRYVCVDPNAANSGLMTARRVSLDVNGNRVFDPGTDVVLGWVGQPDAKGLARIVAEIDRYYTDWSAEAFTIWCSNDTHCPSADCGGVAARQCDTGTQRTVLIGDCHTSPGRAYLVQAILSGLPVTEEANYSPSLALSTVAVWGDVIGATVKGVALPPDGGANFGDILGIVKGFQGVGAAPDAWLDIVAVSAADPQPDLVVGFSDILAGVKGFQNQPYDGDDPCTCAGLAPCP